MQSDQEKFYESIFGTNLPSEQKNRERVQDFLNSLPKNSKIEIDEEEKEKALGLPLYHERAMAKHVLSLYKEYYPTFPEIEFVFYKGVATNISFKIIENQKIILIPELWIGLFKNTLVLLSCLEINLQQENKEEIGNNYLTLLICVDSFCKRDLPSDIQNKIDECIKILNGHFTELADLLYSIFAFAICHELSHITLNHCNKINDIYLREYEADSHSYIMFLKLIEQFRYGKTNHPMATAFQDYVAYAPMIFMRIHEMISSYLGTVYNEKQSVKYPTYKQRESALTTIALGKLSSIEQCIENIPPYKLDKKSHDESQMFYDEFYISSEFFITETVLKKQRGKLKILEYD